MYLREVRVQRVKCFEDVRISFIGPDGEVRRWTTLIGENGLGKTTLLQCMAIPLAGPGAWDELLEKNDVDEWGDASMILSASALLEKEDDAVPIKNLFKSLNFSNLKMKFSFINDNLGGAFTFSEVQSFLNSFPSENSPAFAAGYGPFRRLSGGSEDANRILHARRRASRFVTLFREDAAISDLERWLVDLRNLSRDGEAQAERTLGIVRDLLLRDFFMEPIQLEVTATKARLRFGEGPLLALDALSDGYRAMLALGLDLLRGLTESFPAAERPTEMPGVVLIDELDAHLHPRWQRMLGLWLQDRFPRLQFIVATHSPFLAQAAPAGGNVLLRRDVAGRVVAEPQPEAVAGWRAEQILTGLFGLSSTRSPRAEERMGRLIALEKIPHRTPEEEAERQAIQQELDDLPGLQERPEDRETMRLLRRLVQRQGERIRDLE